MANEHHHVESAMHRALHLQRKGDVKTASAIYNEILAIDPAHAGATHFLGMAELTHGTCPDALRLLRRSTILDPQNANYFINLGSALTYAKQYDDAIAAIRHSINLSPTIPEAHFSLSLALERDRQISAALDEMRAAISLRPTDAWAHFHVGRLNKYLRLLFDALNSLEHALHLNADLFLAYVEAADVLTLLGRTDDAIAQYRHLPLHPKWARAHSARLHISHASTSISRSDLAQSHQELGNIYSTHNALRASTEIECRRSSRSHRLRVAYLSADFRQHPVATFLEPILSNHNLDDFEIYGYCDVLKPDEVTSRFSGLVPNWRECSSLSDDDLYSIIQSDRIDILVDLAGHLRCHRLPVFAHRAAAVQISYLGYPDTSGIANMDVRLTDSCHDPVNFQAGCTERLIRLGRCCWCYRPYVSPVMPTALPALKNGYITFAMLNQLFKTNESFWDASLKIIQSVPSSIIIVFVEYGGDIASEVRTRLQRLGYCPDRYRIVERTDVLASLIRYNGVDIALDTFPYNGHTTTCDAIWMGVPTITLIGDSHVSRAGLSVLSAVGLQELACPTIEAYIETAVRLANDVERLATLRSTLRSRMEASALRDEVGLTRKIERVYKAAWRQYQSGRPLKKCGARADARQYPGASSISQ